MTGRFDWTEANVAELARLAARGWSATEIAIVIKAPSRNAVIGKARRLGIQLGQPVTVESAEQPTELQKSPQARKTANPKVVKPAEPAKVAAPVVAVPAPVPVLPPEPHALGERVTLMDLRSGDCRWPLGDPATTSFGFCGCRAPEGRPYCATHAAVAYAPRAERRAHDRAITKGVR